MFIESVCYYKSSSEQIFSKKLTWVPLCSSRQTKEGYTVKKGNREIYELAHESELRKTHLHFVAISNHLSKIDSRLLACLLACLLARVEFVARDD